MIDLDDVTVPVIVAALCHCHHTAIGGIDRPAFTVGDVNAQVSGPVVIAGEEMIGCGPYKGPTSHRTAAAGTLAGRGGSRFASCHSRYQPLHEFALAARDHHPGP